MKNFLIVCSALTLVLVGRVAQSSVPSELSANRDLRADRVAQLKIADSTGSNATEVDGVRLEILMPERELIIPNERHNPLISSCVKSCVRIGIRFTNKTALPLRFTLFDTLAVELSAADGYRVLNVGGARSMGGLPKETDYPLIKPGETATFWKDASVKWINEGKELGFGFPDGFGGGWSFSNLKPNQYKLKFFYHNDKTTAAVYNLGTNQMKLLDSFWVGDIVSAAVEINLIAEKNKSAVK